MTSKQILGFFTFLAVCAIALMPIATLGVVYGVITTCILLSLVPVSVETIMAEQNYTMAEQSYNG